MHLSFSPISSAERRADSVSLLIYTVFVSGKGNSGCLYTDPAPFICKDILFPLQVRAMSVAFFARVAISLGFMSHAEESPLKRAENCCERIRLKGGSVSVWNVGQKKEEPFFVNVRLSLPDSVHSSAWNPFILL